MKNKLFNWFLVFLSVLGLIFVRVLEHNLFYDPFISYFKHSGNSVFPNVEWLPLVGSHIFRFGLNLLFSALVLQFMFSNKKWTMQGVVLMLIVFFVVFPIYLYCVYSEFSLGELFTFYVRRFVIQPLILLLIIPMFYYRKHLEQKGA